MNEFNDYLAKAQKFKKECSEGDNNRKTRLIKLDENKLVLEIKKEKNKTVKNSFGIRSRNNDDNELNFDSYKDVKKFHIDMGIGALYMYNIKTKIEPSYIKKEFRKKTMEKYKGNKGVFFGTKFKEIIEDFYNQKLYYDIPCFFIDSNLEEPKDIFLEERKNIISWAKKFSTLDTSNSSIKKDLKIKLEEKLTIKQIMM
jgi:hypothetical protein